MKKQILSLLLVLLIVPSVFLFSGCKDDSYQLKNLETDYQNMVSGCENIKCEDNKIVFDYSKHLIGSTQYLNEVIKIEPYNQILNYNELFNNLMCFVYENIDSCSNNNIEASAETRNELKTEIDDLGLALRSVDVYINQWAEAVEFNYAGDDLLNVQCISRYRYLLSAYNELYQNAISFSNSIANLYYNNALSNSNPRIDNIELADFDSGIVIAKLQSRVQYQISNLSQLFVEKYVDGFNMEYVIAPLTGVYGSLNLNKDNYQTKVNKLKTVINDSFDVETAITIANGESKKQTFYNWSIMAYNLQNILDNDNFMFVSACNKIQYGKAEADDRYKIIIDNYDSVVQQYNIALLQMIDCLQA